MTPFAGTFAWPPWTTVRAGVGESLSWTAEDWLDWGGDGDGTLLVDLRDLPPLDGEPRYGQRIEVFIDWLPEACPWGDLARGDRRQIAVLVCGTPGPRRRGSRGRWCNRIDRRPRRRVSRPAAEAGGEPP